MHTLGKIIRHLLLASKLTVIIQKRLTYGKVLKILCLELAKNLNMTTGCIEIERKSKAKHSAIPQYNIPHRVTMSAQDAIEINEVWGQVTAVS